MDDREARQIKIRAETARANKIESDLMPGKTQADYLKSPVGFDLVCEWAELLEMYRRAQEADLTLREYIVRAALK